MPNWNRFQEIDSCAPRLTIDPRACLYFPEQRFHHPEIPSTQDGNPSAPSLPVSGNGVRRGDGGGRRLLLPLAGISAQRAGEGEANAHLFREPCALRRGQEQPGRHSEAQC